MRLPNPHKAVVALEKLRNYSLNPSHPVGKHKARVFRSALDLTQDDADWLRERAFEIAATDDAVASLNSVFGHKYVIDSELNHQGKSAMVRFCWIVEFGTDFPRFNQLLRKSKRPNQWMTLPKTTLWLCLSINLILDCGGAMLELSSMSSPHRQSTSLA